jgi:hypothetical protein
MAAEPEDAVSRWLWARANANRASGEPFNLSRLFDEARNSHLGLTWRDVSRVIETGDYRTHGWTPAQFVLDFLRCYLAGRKAACLIDPAATSPVPLLALADGDIAERAIGFSPQPALPEAATGAAENPRVGWHEGWYVPPVSAGLPTLGAPELIVSFPPAGMRPEGAVCRTTTGESVSIRESAGLHVLLTAAELSEDGEAIFLVPNGFLFRRQATAMRQVLPLLGLHVHACVNVLGALRVTGIPFNLIFIRKSPVEPVWVGQLSPQVDVARLAANLAERRLGRTTELGRQVDWERFEGFEQLANRERADALAARAGFPMVPLSDALFEALEGPPKGKNKPIELPFRTSRRRYLRQCGG